MRMVLMSVRARRLSVLGCMLMFLVATGCVSAGPASSASTRHGLTVVTGFYPLQFIAQRLAGVQATVISLTQPGAEPHDLELSPRQVASLTTASLVIYEKGFQPAVDEAVLQSENQQVIDITTIVPLRPLALAGGDDLDAEHRPSNHDSALDPHVWLDPTALDQIAGVVAERLATIDPDHATEYARNAATLGKQLRTLDRSFRAGLAHCARKEFITTHAAFGYLAQRYHLTQIPISGISPDAEPSPIRIAAVQRLAVAHGLTTIFSETLVSPALAQAIAGDLGLVTDVLDPIEGITDQSRGDDYLSVMSANLAALRKAGGCS